MLNSTAEQSLRKWNAWNEQFQRFAFFSPRACWEFWEIWTKRKLFKCCLTPDWMKLLYVSFLILLLKISQLLRERRHPISGVSKKDRLFRPILNWVTAKFVRSQRPLEKMGTLHGGYSTVAFESGFVVQVNGIPSHIRQRVSSGHCPVSFRHNVDKCWSTPV